MASGDEAAGGGNQRACRFADEVVPAGLLQAAPGELSSDELEQLWELFRLIGREWKNVVADSAGQRSSWLEFVALRCREAPSYLAEYRSALKVVRELVEQHGLVDGHRRLLSNPVLSETVKQAGGVKTRLHHAKVFVVDEFIRVQVVAGGFRGFGGRNRAYNYNGFVRGSRYNRVQRVRAYRARKSISEKKRGPA